MVPEAVFMQAEDEVFGILVAEFGGAEEHDIRFVTGDRGAGRRERLGILPLQISSRTRDEQPARVLVHVRALRII